MRAAVAGVALGAVALILPAAGGDDRAGAAASSTPSTADATVSSGAPKSNTGAANRLTLCTGCDGSATTKRAYVRFTVTGLTGEVTDARLRLWAPAGAVPVMSAATSSPAWVESTITWRTAPAPGATVGTSVAGTARGWYEIPLAPGTVTGDSTYSFVLSTAASAPLKLASREGGAAVTPQLSLKVAGDPVIVAAGDIAPKCSGPGCGHAKTAAVVAAIDPTAVLVLGDNQYPDGAIADYLTYYDATWGAFLDRTWPVPGNHEYRADPTAGGYFTYFGARAADPAEGWYSVDVGTWHVVALNTNYDCTKVACAAGSAQEQWLEADLAATDQPCILAFWHHPRWSSGSEHGSSPVSSAFWADLYAVGADVVLNGHDHDYERFEPQAPNGALDADGIREFVVGTGGKSLEPLGPPIANSAARNDTTLGVLKLTLHANSYDWAFAPVAGGTYQDAGSASCHD